MLDNNLEIKFLNYRLIKNLKCVDLDVYFGIIINQRFIYLLNSDLF